MTFKKGLPPEGDLQGRHGLVVHINNGDENGARKMARIFFEQNSCEKEVEFIYNPQPNLWVFVWPEGSFVQMPAIHNFVSQRMMQFCRPFTLKEYFSQISK